MKKLWMILLAFALVTGVTGLVFMGCLSGVEVSEEEETWEQDLEPFDITLRANSYGKTPTTGLIGYFYGGDPNDQVIFPEGFKITAGQSFSLDVEFTVDKDVADLYIGIVDRDASNGHTGLSWDSSAGGTTGMTAFVDGAVKKGEKYAKTFEFTAIKTATTLTAKANNFVLESNGLRSLDPVKVSFTKFVLTFGGSAACDCGFVCDKAGCKCDGSACDADTCSPCCVFTPDSKTDFDKETGMAVFFGRDWDSGFTAGDGSGLGNSQGSLKTDLKYGYNEKTNGSFLIDLGSKIQYSSVITIEYIAIREARGDVKVTLKANRGGDGDVAYLTLEPAKKSKLIIDVQSPEFAGLDIKNLNGSGNAALCFQSNNSGDGKWTLRITDIEVADEGGAWYCLCIGCGTYGKCSCVFNCLAAASCCNENPDGCCGPEDTDDGEDYEAPAITANSGSSYGSSYNATTKLWTVNSGYQRATWDLGRSIVVSKHDGKTLKIILEKDSTSAATNYRYNLRNYKDGQVYPVSTEWTEGTMSAGAGTEIISIPMATLKSANVGHFQKVRFEITGGGSAVFELSIKVE
jgi:hypothetical protein